MALLKEIRESVIRRANAGIDTDETRGDNAFWDSQIHKARALVIRELWKNTKRVNPVWIQTFKPTYVSGSQDDDCCVKFQSHHVISLDAIQDGYRYIGTTEGNLNFRRVVSRGQLSNFNLNRVTKIGRKQTVLIDNNACVIEVYGNPDIEEILVELIAAIPTDIPTYNPDYDQYPISEDMIPLIEDKIFKSEAIPVYSKTPDRVSDSQDLENK